MAASRQAVGMWSAAAAAAGLLALPWPVEAQPLAGAAPPPLDLPSERPREIPFPERAPGEILPPPPPALPAEPVPELRIQVDAIQIVGSTVFGDSDLRELVAPYIGRELTTRSIEAIREELTLHYVDRGFVTSGAIVPDQDFENGTLELRIIEGRIGTLSIEGNERFRTRYLADRIVPDRRAPINIHVLEERLQLLQRDAEIRTVHAELAPGLQPGESILRVRIEEDRWYSLALDVSDHRPPSLGDVFGRFDAGARNLAGWGDRLALRGQFGEGLNDILADYEIPITPRDTRLRTRFRWAESRIVAAPFDVLDITSDFIGAGAELVHPVVRNLLDQVDIGLRFEWRRGRNFVGGVPFSFSEGADRGVSTVAPLRLWAEWVRSDPVQVIALRGQLSAGLPILGATDVPGALADARFVSGILQAQWARRFDRLRGMELIARTNLQVASDPLLPIEQFSVGGHDSVRGYVDNQIVSDNGFDATVELRVPLWRRPDGRSVLQLAPFFDVGRGWSDGEREVELGQTLAGIGAGLRWFPARRIYTELYYGYPLIDLEEDRGSSPQAHGIYFMLSASLF